MDSLSTLTATTAQMAQTAPKLPLTGDAKNAAARQQAAEDFEAVFISQMLMPMLNTVEVDPMFGGGHAEETWRGILAEETGKEMARAGGIGIADMVAKEMLKLQEAQEVPHGTQ